jgi:uncharacterized membrane protein YgcG
MVMTLDWLVTGFYISQLMIANITMNAFHENKRKYVNFQQVMAMDSAVALLLACSAFFGIIRFMKLLRFNKRISMLTKVLSTSARQWPGFFMIAIVFYISFIHIGYLMFSPFLADFQSLMTSCETMFSVTMGRPIYSELRSLYRICGPAFYFTFSFMAAFIILNVLISIINESYSFTVEQMNKQQNQYEIVDFMMKRFAKWTGLSVLQGDKGNPKKIAPMAAPSEVPLPELPGNVQTSYNHQYVELQKTFDQYLYDLEHKYSKFLTLEELREEVMGEMAQVPQRNDRVHGGVRRNRRISRMSAARLPPSIAYQDRNYLFMSSESGSSSGFPSTSSRTGPSSSSGASTYGSSSSGTYTSTSSSSGASSSGKSGRSGPSTSSRKPSSTAGPARRISSINTVSAKAGARKY